MRGTGTLMKSFVAFDLSQESWCHSCDRARPIVVSIAFFLGVIVILTMKDRCEVGRRELNGLRLPDFIFEFHTSMLFVHEETRSLGLLDGEEGRIWKEARISGEQVSGGPEIWIARPVLRDFMTQKPRHR